MGNSCSSGQAHKDKDNMSQKSEESASYQVRTSLPSEKQQTLLNHITHTGVILEPSTAGQTTYLQTTGDTKKAAPLCDLKNPSLAKIIKGTSDSMSLSSPLSPKGFERLNEDVPKEVSSLTENLQHLIMGRIAVYKPVLKSKKIVVYVCAADSQDCTVEKGSLHNTVYPALRQYCRTKGYELHIVDLHWKTLLEKQQDHEFPELCIGELIRQIEVAYVIPVLFLNNSLGTQLLPIRIESTDFKMALESTENQTAQTLLKKWYTLDNDAQPPCYRLRPISCHIPGFDKNALEDREKAFQEWAVEMDRMLAVLINVFSLEMRDSYLTTVVEQEVHNTVFMSQEMAKRCIWMNRVYTPTPKTPDNPSPGEEEAIRRLNILQKDLRDQLSEKHIVRIQVKYSETGLSLDVPGHKEYIAAVQMHLHKHLQEGIDSIIEEHTSKNLIKPSYGIEASLFEELNQQAGFCQKASQCSINRERTIEEIHSYMAGDKTSPLVIVGPSGCGKTTLLSKIAIHCPNKFPEAFLILRFIGISAQSNTIEQLLSSIAIQCSILTYGHQCFCNHTVEEYKEVLPNLLKANSTQRPLILIIDGLDQVREYSCSNTNWIPSKLPDNVKLIISVTENSDMHLALKLTIKDEKSYISMPVLGQHEAKNVLMSSVMQYNPSVNPKVQEKVLKSVEECSIPLYSKVVAWQTSWWVDKDHDFEPKGHLLEQLDFMLEELESIIGKSQVEHALALISCSKYGITDSEILDLLAYDENFQSNSTYVPWAPACLTWPRLVKHLAPFLIWSLTGGMQGIQWKDYLLKKTVLKRYEKFQNWAHQALFDYYDGKLQLKGSLQEARMVTQENNLGKCYNKRKLDELPYHHHHLGGHLETSIYLNEINWIYDKLCGSNAFQLLEDISLIGNSISNSFIKLLKEFLEVNCTVLNYDGRQFYSYLFTFLKSKNRNEKEEEIYGLCKNPPVLTLFPLNHETFLEKEAKDLIYFDLIVKIPNSNRFVVTISTNEEKLCVWDILECKIIRTLEGVPHPTNLIPIDAYMCIVLCRRELRIYNLNSGTFVTKLKGVMNQKMPFYGLHDKNHLVALHRNRMYINLMNLESGDCVTTFKAGEDRFLNSLLVSGDGRVLVCGDETQKPFPLLVWNLKSKKLLYDLRIPHHDFITSLSAITYEGSYVCCVCHEIDEDSPNFIVVYDLQSGTLFKKWKPSCNTVSLEISSQSGCVISGLEDARILVWDLITGNCRFSLSGHTAPVSSLKLDPSGALCLSTDVQCRDRSIRLWDLNKGSLVAVYTSKAKINSYEVTKNGRHIVLGLLGYDNLIVLELRGSDLEEFHLDETYGDKENYGKSWQLTDEIN